MINWRDKRQQGHRLYCSIYVYAYNADNRDNGETKRGATFTNMD